MFRLIAVCIIHISISPPGMNKESGDGAHINHRNYRHISFYCHFIWLHFINVAFFYKLRARISPPAKRSQLSLLRYSGSETAIPWGMTVFNIYIERIYTQGTIHRLNNRDLKILLFPNLSFNTWKTETQSAKMTCHSHTIS